MMKMKKMNRIFPKMIKNNKTKLKKIYKKMKNKKKVKIKKIKTFR